MIGSHTHHDGDEYAEANQVIKREHDTVPVA
jgi:hypothetical protein